MSRKYGQQGYQEGGREERRPGRPPRRRDAPTGPRGRGLGKPTVSVLRCAVCGARQGIETVESDSACHSCEAALHTCTHCSHFDPSAPGECREAAVPYIASKAKPNDCQSFKVKRAQEFGRETMSASEARAAFDALFKI